MNTRIEPRPPLPRPHYIVGNYGQHPDAPDSGDTWAFSLATFRGDIAAREHAEEMRKIYGNATVFRVSYERATGQ